MNKVARILLSAVVVAAAVAIFLVKYWDYVTNPWTRDGQVRAQVIQVTPRVSGPIVKLPIEDNQLVKAGDTLFEIDPRTFAASLDQARANLDRTHDDIKALQKQIDAAAAIVKQSESAVEQAKIEIKGYLSSLKDAKVKFERTQALVKKGSISKQRADDLQAGFEVAQAKADRAKSALIQAGAAGLQAQADLAVAQAKRGAQGDANAQLRQAQAAVKDAELNLEFTQVKAPVDGYVTNLNLRLGSQGVTNQPALALVDINSFWVHGFFRETLVGGIRPGDRAVVTLMSYPDTPLEGRVNSLGWGIAQSDGSTGFDLLPTISPTFEWIRLAQRVPVRVHLADLPAGVELRVGTTASVLVMTGTAADADGPGAAAATPAAPAALQ